MKGGAVTRLAPSRSLPTGLLSWPGRA